MQLNQLNQTLHKKCHFGLKATEGLRAFSVFLGVLSSVLFVINYFIQELSSKNQTTFQKDCASVVEPHRFEGW